MPYTRRKFLHLAAGGVAARAWLSTLAAQAAPPPPFQAIAFDAFPIFDPRPIVALAGTLFPGQGTELSAAWRTRQFEYQWLRTVAGQYTDFWQATDDALGFAATLLHLELTPDKRQQLMAAWLRLQAWPEVPQALQTLKRAGLRLAFLSNATPQILHAGIQHAQLEGVFDQVLSTDQIRTYKPDPRAYQMAIDALQLQWEAILFVAFAGWDVAGATWFGYPTFWVNRLQLPAEALGVAPDAIGRDLTEVVRFVQTLR